jgi:pimeloyl-ACP methyl ester carboxylesterase
MESRLTDAGAAELRQRLRLGAMATERRIVAAGIDTVVLECGQGPPLVLLHGPGGFAEAWVEVMPALAAANSVVAPDLPGHGVSGGADSLDAGRLLAWLGDVIDRTCAQQPVILGHLTGGALAARFALDHPEGVARLVLVDTLGLAPFEPVPAFGEAIGRFYADPTEHSYDDLMEYCSYDADAVRRRLGETWRHIAAYAVDRLRSPAVAAAAMALISEFSAEIPKTTLARIAVPTALIWGRHDLATPLRVAETASRALGWPLRVIEDAADEPSLDQPEAFVAALQGLTNGDGLRRVGDRIEQTS